MRTCPTFWPACSRACAALSVAFALLVCLLGSGCWRPDDQGRARATQPDKASFSTTPDEILAAYTENAPSADSRHQGQRVEVRGEIASISGSADRPVVYLTASKFLSSVRCNFRSYGDAHALRKGDRVKLLGTVERGGSGTSVTLNDCVPAP